MFITTKAISRHCTADLAIKGDESLQGTTFKKNDGEKENNSSSTQKGVKKVEKKHEGSNVYTNPLANPQRNPNVDSKRTEPLTEMEIRAIKEAKPLTDEEMEKVIRELFFEKVERTVKQNGKVKFEGKRYHVGRKMSGETVEVTVTLRGGGRSLA